MSSPISLAEEKRVESKCSADKEVDVKETGDSRGKEYLAEAKEALAECEEESFMRNRKAGGAKKLTLSTTSSVYAEHTISNPDNDQVKYCIAAILQAQIFDDCSNDELTNLDAASFFELHIQLSAEYGGEVTSIPENILNHETLNDLDLREKLISGEVPTVDTIYRFISMMIGVAEYSVECNILALIYINRITSRNKMPLTMQNWRGLWIASVIIAQKIWDDRPLKTSSFVRILPNTTKEQLKDVEMRAFTLLDFNTTVRPSVYAKYYFELRQLFKEIVGSNQRYQFKMEPMTIAEAKRLEYRTALRGATSARSTPMPSTSSTIGSLKSSPPSNASIISTPNNMFSPGTKSKTLDDVKSVGRFVIN